MNKISAGGSRHYAIRMHRVCKKLYSSDTHLERSVHPWQGDLLMESSLACVSTVPRAVGQEGAALVHPCQLVLQHSELIDLSKLLKHRPQVVIFQVTWDLPDKELHGVIVLLASFYVMLLDGQREG